MVEIGDEITFVPSAYISGPGTGNNGTEAAREHLERSEVVGVVTQINQDHRWYRVTYKPKYDREQHECFKF